MITFTPHFNELGSTILHSWESDQYHTVLVKNDWEWLAIVGAANDGLAAVYDELEDDFVMAAMAWTDWKYFLR